MMTFLPVGRYYNLFGIKMPIFATFFVIGIVLAIFSLVYYLRKYKIERKEYARALIHFAFWMFLGFHLFHYIIVRKTAEGLFNITGNDSAGIFLGIVAAMVYLHMKNLDIRKFFDSLAVPCLVVSAVIRISDTLIGDKIGTASALPWSIYQEGIQRHPIGLYYFLSSLLILAIVYSLSTTKILKIKKGDLFLYALVFLGISRLMLDSFRQYPPHDYLGLSIHQMIWGISAIAGLMLLIFNREDKY